MFFVDLHQLYCHLEEDFATLDHMMTRLQAVYGKGMIVLLALSPPLNRHEIAEESVFFCLPLKLFGAGEKARPKTLLPGMACVALFQAVWRDLEHTWNRAQILSFEGNYVELFFIDYGHSHKCQLQHIRAIEDEFLTVPPMAYYCRLAGIDVTDTLDDDDMMRFIKEARSCEATFFSHGVRFDRIVNSTRVVLNELFGFPKTTDIDVPVEDYSSMAVPSHAADVRTVHFVSLDKFFLSPADLSAYEVFVTFLTRILPVKELEKVISDSHQSFPHNHVYNHVASVLLFILPLLFVKLRGH